MTNKNVTKRALLTSVLTIVVCFTMLIGSTFAWFTDTASTAVNKIVSGTLDIDVYYGDNAEGGEGTVWTKLEDNTPPLSFLRKQEDGSLAQDAGMLWEPNGTYCLPALKIVNNGNLALKYKVIITGIKGDSELNNVIDWTMVLDGADFVMGSEHSLAAKVGDVVDADILTVKGHMWATADNHYQNKSIEGINIQVLATQDAVESDSFGNDYDKTADGTPQFDTWYDHIAATVAVDPAVENVIKDREVDPTVTATVPAESTTATKLTLIKTKTTAPSTITVDAGAQAVSADVKLVDQNGNKVTAADGKFFTVTMQLDRYLTVKAFYHHDVALTKARSAAAVSNANDQYYYNTNTGVVTFTTDDFSPFTAIVAFDGGNGTAAHPYIISTAEQAMAMGTTSSYYKLVNDVVVTGETVFNKKCTVDLNGHSVTLEYPEGSAPRFSQNGVFTVRGSGSSLTINDSSAEQTGAIYGTDTPYDKKVTSVIYAARNAKVIINGGHFYSRNDSACIYTNTAYNANSAAFVTINGGIFEVKTPSNGKYYVLNHEDRNTPSCKMTVNGGKFKEYNPGVTEVDPVNAYTGKIVLGSGCTTTSEVIDGATWYTVSK